MNKLKIIKKWKKNEVLLCVPHHTGEKLSNVAKTLGVILEAGLSVEQHISSVVLFFFFFFFISQKIRTLSVIG